jgi:hypothetical protein
LVTCSNIFDRIVLGAFSLRCTREPDERYPSAVGKANLLAKFVGTWRDFAGDPSISQLAGD